MLKKIRRLRVKLPVLALAMMAFALVGHAVLGVTYLQQQRQQDALASEIEAANKSLVEYGDAATRQERLAAAEAELAAGQAAFPSRLSGSATVGAVLQLAEDSGLRVAALKSQPGGRQQVGQHTYHVLLFNVQVEGTLDSLRSFISKVERDALQAGNVDELSLTLAVQPADANGPGTADSQPPLTASLDLSFYARNSP